MSYKVYILRTQLEKFKDNIGAYLKKHRQRFHQGNEKMVVDYIWRDSIEEEYDKLSFLLICSYFIFIYYCLSQFLNKKGSYVQQKLF